MTLLSAVPGGQRLLTGESLCVSVRAADGAVVSWWRSGVKVADGETLLKADVKAADAGTYVVRAVKGADEEIHTVPVAVAPVERSLSLDLPRKWHGGTVAVALLVAAVGAVALAGGPVTRAVRLSQLDDGRPDAAMIASVATSAGVVLLMAGVFVGAMTVLTRAQSEQPDRVEAEGVDPAQVAKVVASLHRPRLAVALLGAGLLLVAVAAVLAWRLAGAAPPAQAAAVAAVVVTSS